jgi:hypothetical protein
MAEDHYVAQTYLKHFAGANGMLHAYRKSDGSSFPCWPRDICRETDGDIIPDFLAEPTYLGEFRAATEPHWNPSLAALKERAVGAQDKYSMSAYWANLLVCTPAWRRLGIDRSNQLTRTMIKAAVAAKARAGVPDEILEKAVIDLEEGRIRLDTEPDYVRAQYARMVRKYTWIIFNAQWHIYESNSDLKYFTSDNPASFEDPIGSSPGNAQFIRYLPVTPELCLTCNIAESARKFRDVEPDFTKEPEGKVSGGFISREMIDRVNTRTAKCAEDLLICGADDDYVRGMARRYGKFRIEGEMKEFASPGSSYIFQRTFAGERADEAGVRSGTS